MASYKLYNTACGYRCRVTIEEIKFLFDYLGADDREAINNYLINHATGYYIK